MTMQNLQIPETTESRIVPKWLFPPRFSDIDRFTSSRSYIVLVTPISAKPPKETNYCRWVGSSEWQGPTEGEWEHPSSAASHQQSHQPRPDSTDLKTSANLGMTSISSRSSIVKTPDLRTS